MGIGTLRRRYATVEPDGELDGEPNVDWTVEQLRAYAATHGVHLGGATRKTDILAALQAAIPSD